MESGGDFNLERRGGDGPGRGGARASGRNGGDRGGEHSGSRAHGNGGGPGAGACDRPRRTPSHHGGEPAGKRPSGHRNQRAQRLPPAVARSTLLEDLAPGSYTVESVAGPGGHTSGAIVNHGNLRLVHTRHEGYFASASFNQGTAEIESALFRGNMAPYGGAICHRADLTVRGSVFDFNVASNEGGAIYTAGTARIESSTFSNNLGEFPGGAIHNAGTLWPEQSSRTYNEGSSFGGGIVNLGSLTAWHHRRFRALLCRGALHPRPHSPERICLVGERDAVGQAHEGGGRRLSLELRRVQRDSLHVRGRDAPDGRSAD